MERPLRILHVYKDFWPPVPGGIEKHIHLLAYQQARRGHSVTVLVTNPTAFPYSLQTQVEERHVSPTGRVRIIRAGRLFTLASTPISPAQAWWQRRLTADVVHLHFPYPPGEVANDLWGRGRVTVLTYHSDVIRQQRILRVYRRLLHRILRRVHVLIATSDAYVRSSPILSAHRDRVRVIPLGIDLAPYRQIEAAQVQAWRQQYTAPHPEWPVVLFVGRLRYYKGVDVLLRAVVHLPQVWVWIAGRGPLEDTWRRLARSLGLEERVRFLGDVEEARLPALYAAADVFVLPATSRAEAWGVVLVEAMAAGLPVISTELGTGTSVVNRDGETGRVVPPGDVMALRAALKELLFDPERRRIMGARARARAFREFDIVRVADRVLALYHELLDVP